jgi:hypothetical protein
MRIKSVTILEEFARSRGLDWEFSEDFYSRRYSFRILFQSIEMFSGDIDYRNPDGFPVIFRRGKSTVTVANGDDLRDCLTLAGLGPVPPTPPVPPGMPITLGEISTAVADWGSAQLKAAADRSPDILRSVPPGIDPVDLAKADAEADARGQPPRGGWTIGHLVTVSFPGQFDARAKVLDEPDNEGNLVVLVCGGPHNGSKIRVHRSNIRLGWPEEPGRDVYGVALEDSRIVGQECGKPVHEVTVAPLGPSYLMHRLEDCDLPGLIALRDRLNAIIYDKERGK